MELKFPESSRTYYATRVAIRFWAYDQAIEIVFIVQNRALLRIDSDSKTDEAGLLDTFDVNRDRIHRLASKLYSCRHISSYASSFTLTASDF